MKDFQKISNHLFMLLLLAIFAIGCNKKSEQFKIEGTVAKEMAIDSMNIYDESGKVMFSSPVKDGKFTLTGHTDEIVNVGLGNANKNMVVPIILENDAYKVNFNNDGSYTIDGGKIHQILFKHYKDPVYQQLVKDYQVNSDKAFEGIDMQNEEQVNKARKIMDEYQGKVFDYEEKINKEITNGDYPEIAKMHVFLNSNGYGMKPEEVNALIAKYEKEFPNHPNLMFFKKGSEEYEKNLAAKKNVEVGMPFIDISGKDRDGKEIKLSDLVAKNKFTILEFWASWCGPCRAEIPNLKKAYAKYNAKGLEIYSISVDSKHDNWIKALDEENTTWPNSLVEGDFRNPIVGQYGVDGIPASFLISQDGKIVASNQELREFELDRTLSKLIK